MEVGDLVFSQCPSLEFIEVDKRNKNLVSKDGVLFCGKMLLACPGGKVGSYTIPRNTTEIMSYSFDSCTELTSISIPGSVEYIGTDAFCNCTSLKKLTIPDYVNFDDMSSESFPDDCEVRYRSGMIYKEAIKDPEVPNDMIMGCSIDHAYFYRYIGRSYTVTIPSELEKLPVTIIAQNAFLNHVFLRTVVLPETVKEIGRTAFSGCINLTSITLPVTIESIGNSAFWGCKSLKSITIGRDTKLGINAIPAGCTIIRKAPENVFVADAVISINPVKKGHIED
jgi:hypothetical protein